MTIHKSLAQKQVSDTRNQDNKCCVRAQLDTFRSRRYFGKFENFQVQLISFNLTHQLQLNESKSLRAIAKVCRLFIGFLRGQVGMA